MMNVVEINKLREVNHLLNVVLEGKVEHLPEAKQAKEIIWEMIEFQNIEAWKFAQD